MKDWFKAILALLLNILIHVVLISILPILLLMGLIERTFIYIKKQLTKIEWKI